MVLEPIPEIPENIRVAAAQGTLVPFIGAGASQIGGCPGWDAFADKVLQYFISKNILDHSEFEQLRHLSPKFKLHIAIQLKNKHKINIPFKTLLNLDSNNANHNNGQKLFKFISNLGRSIVTTNYDDWLENTILSTDLQLQENSAQISHSESKRRSIYKSEDFTIFNFNIKPSILHLHGSISDPDSMVMTTRDYLTHYAYSSNNGRENYVINFLNNLFHKYTVLFIGYSLEELEILEYILQKGLGANHSTLSVQEPRHYMLQGYFSHQKQLLEHFESYYRTLGVQLIPFSRDTKDWHQLIEILDDFSKNISFNKPSSIERRRIMEDLANDL